MISEKNRALTQQSGDIGYLPVFASHGLGPVLDRLLNAAREEGRTQSQAEATPKAGSVDREAVATAKIAIDDARMMIGDFSTFGPMGMDALRMFLDRASELLVLPQSTEQGE